MSLLLWKCISIDGVHTFFQEFCPEKSPVSNNNPSNSIKVREFINGRNNRVSSFQLLGIRAFYSYLWPISFRTNNSLAFQLCRQRPFKSQFFSFGAATTHLSATGQELHYFWIALLISHNTVGCAEHEMLGHHVNFRYLFGELSVFDCAWKARETHIGLLGAT